jgi:hypothetical protein
MPLLFNDPAHWRQRAAEARTIADQMTDPEGKRRMLEVAENYNRIADRAEERVRQTLSKEDITSAPGAADLPERT